MLYVGMYSPYYARLFLTDALIMALIHIGVGFCVARFDKVGNARASECGTGNG